MIRRHTSANKISIIIYDVVVDNTHLRGSHTPLLMMRCWTSVYKISKIVHDIIVNYTHLHRKIARESKMTLHIIVVNTLCLKVSPATKTSVDYSDISLIASAIVNLYCFTKKSTNYLKQQTILDGVRPPLNLHSTTLSTPTIYQTFSCRHSQINVPILSIYMHTN